MRDGTQIGGHHETREPLEQQLCSRTRPDEARLHPNAAARDQPRCHRRRTGLRQGDPRQGTHLLCDRTQGGSEVLGPGS